MAKALLALALCLCISFSALAAPQKKTLKWTELTPEQQQILAPLAADWDKLELKRRHKWLAIAKRYPQMKPNQQMNAQRRMQAWVKLTPQEREAARERYKKIAKLPPDKKRALKQEWDEYNRLPEQERRKLGSAPRRPAPAPETAPAAAPVGPAASLPTPVPTATQ